MLPAAEANLTTDWDKDILSSYNDSFFEFSAAAIKTISTGYRA